MHNAICMAVADIGPRSRGARRHACPSMAAMAQSGYSRGQGMGLAFVLVWCTGYIAGKLAVAHGAPFTVLAWRFGITALLFAGMGLALRARWPTWTQAAHSAVAGVLMLACHFGGVYWAFLHGANAGISALVIGCMPLLVAVMSAASGQERLDRRGWLGLGIGLAGVAMVVADRLEPAASAAAWIGLGVGLVGIALGTVYQKRHASAVDPRCGLAVQNAAAALVLLPFAAGEGFAHDAGTAFLGPLAWLVVVNSIGGFTLLFMLIRRGAAASVASLFFLMPAVTAMMGRAWFGEPVTWTKAAGFVLSAAGVWLTTHAARRQPD